MRSTHSMQRMGHPIIIDRCYVLSFAAANQPARGIGSAIKTNGTLLPEGCRATLQHERPC